MVYPITGPNPITTYNGYRYQRKDKYTQAKPVSMPLPYMSNVAEIRKFEGQYWFDPWPPATISSSLEAVAPSKYKNAALLAAYERFRSQVSDQAQMGVALLELERSASMIFRRATQLLGFLRNLRRLDFLGAAAALKVSAVPKGAKVTNSVASNWLEFSFGWSPLIGDIYSAVDVLQNPIKSIRPMGRATGGSDVVSNISGSYPSSYTRQDFYFTLFAQVSAEVTVDNPNLWLANNLGLINPGTIIWELIPFSFVVDWFIPVEAFLSWGTDLYGLGITNAWHNYTHRGQYIWKTHLPSIPRDGTTVWDVVQTRRILGLPGPNIFVRPFKVPSWRRAANAVSLLVQQLGGR